MWGWKKLGNWNRFTPQAGRSHDYETSSLHSLSTTQEIPELQHHTQQDVGTRTDDDATTLPITSDVSHGNTQFHVHAPVATPPATVDTPSGQIAPTKK